MALPPAINTFAPSSTAIGWGPTMMLGVPRLVKFDMTDSFSEKVMVQKIIVYF
jgi:hypothetical protein